MVVFTATEQLGSLICPLRSGPGGRPPGRAFLSASTPPSLSPPFRNWEDSQEYVPLGPVEEQEFWKESHSGRLVCSGNIAGFPLGVSSESPEAALILLTQADLETLQPTDHGLLLTLPFLQGAIPPARAEPLFASQVPRDGRGDAKDGKQTYHF